MSELAERAIPTRQQMDALRELVRWGDLTGEQRDKLGWLLHLIGAATRRSAEVELAHPDRDALWWQTYRAVSWEPVGAAYAELVAAVTR